MEDVRIVAWVQMRDEKGARLSSKNVTVSSTGYHGVDGMVKIEVPDGPAVHVEVCALREAINRCSGF